MLENNKLKNEDFEDQLYGDHDTQPEESIKDIIYNVWLPKVQKMRFA